MTHKYIMTISRNTIDKLGVRLYDKAADVISELISNAYDADAENVTVSVPLDVFLATKKGGKITDKGYKIIVEDDGHGMDEREANLFYLKVGTERRTDKNRKNWGTRSKFKRRPVMGRKGIGKLSAFGICKKIEIISAANIKKNGKYVISNFILNFDDINEDTEKEYHPKIGNLDGKTTDKPGTKIILTDFLYRAIPDKETFLRQIARKFGLNTTDFAIKVRDTISNQDHIVTELDLPRFEKTVISVDNRKINVEGKKYPVKGWVGYSSTPYANEEMAGVRIYARGKLAAVTRDFGHKAGFTGEFTLRSYLIGVIHADWLDEDKDEDLIASDRQDILWSSEKGKAFKEWGQILLRELGRKSAGPLREKTFEIFSKKSNFEIEAKKRFGGTKVYQAAMDLGHTLGSRADRSSLDDKDYITSLLELILSIAPHTMIVEKLRKIADKGNDSAMQVISSLFGDAKLAETASLGQIAFERINAIEELEKSIRKIPPPKESELQELLEEAPWILQPEWTVLQTNETFENFRLAFDAWYYKKTQKKVKTKSSPKNKNKKPDFVMINTGRSIEIIEIKKPDYRFSDSDFDRLFNYIEKMEEFRKNNKNLSDMLPKTHFTLVCDEIKLARNNKKAYDSFVNEDKIITPKTWEEVLTDTKQSHEDFLRERNKIFKEKKKDNAL